MVMIEINSIMKMIKGLLDTQEKPLPVSRGAARSARKDILPSPDLDTYPEKVADICFSAEQTSEVCIKYAFDVHPPADKKNDCGDCFYKNVGVKLNETNAEFVKRKTEKYSTVSVNLKSKEIKKKTPPQRNKAGYQWMGAKGKKCFPYLLFFSLCCQSSSAAHYLKQPGQLLPNACFSLMEAWYNDCPNPERLGFQSYYAQLNATCCRQFPGKDAHCQMAYDEDGDQFSMVACVRTIMLKGNETGHLSGYGGREPFFKVTINQAFLLDRPSYEVRYAYVIENGVKSECDGVGERVLCKGQSSADNQCACGDGFIADPRDLCKPSYGKNDACHCIEHRCPDGSRAVTVLSHNFTWGQDCDEMPNDLVVSYICVPVLLNLTTPITAVSTTAQPMTPIEEKKEDGKYSSAEGNPGWPVGVRIALVLGLFAFTCLACLTVLFLLFIPLSSLKREVVGIACTGFKTIHGFVPN